MADYNKLIPFILKWEGGFANDKYDKGGPTMKGVTLQTYKNYCRKKGLPEPTIEDLKKISMNTWKDIFKTMYWDRWQADRILSQSIANILVDWVWASGIWGIKIPQRIVNVKDDGIVGEKTLEAINKQNPKELFDKIKQARIEFIDNIVKANPLQQRFYKGWLNRINDLKYEQ